MGAHHQRKNFAKPQRRRFQFESLEARQMLSGNPIVIPIVSGTTYSFRDADGTTVKVKLTGAGGGQMTLTNGLKTGGSIDSLTIAGTNSASQLKITAAGGADDKSTINSLTIGQAPVNAQILQQFTGSRINVSAGGTWQINGSVGDLSIETVGNGASVSIAGGVAGQFVAEKFEANSLVNVAGAVASLNVQTIAAGAEVAAGTLSKLTIGQGITGGSIIVGDGGIQSAFFQKLIDSNVWTTGPIENVTINGASDGSAIAVNRSPGSDGVFNTIDDYTLDPNAAGTIGLVKINHSAGAGDLLLIATGAIGRVQSPAGRPQPAVVDEAWSDYIPLEIAQAFANATTFEDDEIWIAVYGEELIGQALTGPTYYLDAGSLNSVNEPIPLRASKLVAGPDTPDMPILPSFTLAQWKNASSSWGSNLQLPVPEAGNKFSGRILISVGAPVQAQVNSAGAVAAPSASDPTDPSTGTIYDFLEFTTSYDGAVSNLDVDTSQVDSFGLPMTLQFFDDKTAQTPFNVTFNGTVTFGSYTVTQIASTSELQAGQVVTGPGIPPGTVIYSVGTNSITLSAAAVSPASPTGSVVSLSALNGGPVGVDGMLTEILNGDDANSFQEFLNSHLAQHPGKRPFLQSAAPFLIGGGVPINDVDISGNLIIFTDSTANLHHNDWVTISGVNGIPAANASFQVSNITPSSFQVAVANSSGVYGGGGTWSFAITGATNPGASQPIVISASSVGNLQNGDYVELTDVQGNADANGFFQVSNVTPTTFTLVDSNGAGGAYTRGGTWRVYGSGPRLVSPKDIVETINDHASANSLNNYFNEAIDAFFLQYLPNTEKNLDGTTGGNQVFSIQSTASGNLETYCGVVKRIGGVGYCLYLTSAWSKTPFIFYYPFMTTNLPSDYVPKFQPHTPPDSMHKDVAQQSASRMIFACDGVFADNADRAAKSVVPPGWSRTMGDLENSISAAFNRGISLNAPNSWGERLTWFQPGSQGGKHNYWVDYWHNSGMAVNDLAYAFPYDDRFGSSTNLNVNNVELARVLLNRLSYSLMPSAIQYYDFPSSAQAGGYVSLAAYVNPIYEGIGTVTFFIDGVAINSHDFSANPPQQPIELQPFFPFGDSNFAWINAKLPALPDGSSTHTFTVTALYSGDENTPPSVVSQMLKVIASP